MSFGMMTNTKAPKRPGKGKAKAKAPAPPAAPKAAPKLMSTPAPSQNAGGSPPTSMGANQPKIIPSAANKPAGMTMPTKKTMAGMKASIGSLGKF